ncbi:thioredoxin family protein [Oscillatoria laete-virens NRMC-F 0139]|nr:thioredoxin family protein [Oscillatoria laete-virens]MDL5053642.1 thioredoxin family protein [Oscillatoria laete-virens NRMC-F 0139]
MDITNQLMIFLLAVSLLTLAWIVSLLVFVVCSFMRGIGWGILCFFTGYLGGLIAVLVPGENKPVRSFVASVVIFILLIGAIFGGGYYFGNEMKKYVVIDDKLFIRENGEIKELPAVSNPQEEVFRQTLTQIITQSGGQSLDPEFRGQDIQLTAPAIPASAFEITAMLGEEGTQNFNVMFNNNMDYSPDVGESFTFDYQGRKVEVMLKEVTARDVIVVADGHEIKVPRERKSAVVAGDTTAADPVPAAGGAAKTPISASAFRITAMMGTEGTQDFNVMFNNNPAWSVDVGESFTFDHQGRPVEITLKEVTEKEVILIADNQEIKVSRTMQPEAVEGGQQATEGGASASTGSYRGGTWMTSYPQALQIAQRTNRPILLLFTGSDWCPPCKMLDKDVFNTSAFLNYARDNYILVKADFPRKHKLSASQEQANHELAGKFGINGYPSVFLLTPQGANTGPKMGAYQGDNLKIYLDAMQKFKTEQGL